MHSRCSLRLFPDLSSDSAAGKGSLWLQGVARPGLLLQRWRQRLQLATCSARWAPVTTGAAQPQLTRPPGALVGCALLLGGPHAPLRPPQASEQGALAKSKRQASLGLLASSLCKQEGILPTHTQTHKCAHNPIFVKTRGRKGFVSDAPTCLQAFEQVKCSLKVPLHFCSL